MNSRGIHVIALTLLLLGVAIVTSGVWIQGGFSHGVPGNDHGCYCHNGGIAVWYNGTDSGLFQALTVSPGASFVLNVTSSNVDATGVVPGMQEWMSNQTDNARFTFSPASVLANSTQNLSKANGTISALYKITAPEQGGSYTLTAFLQGSSMQVSIDVGGASTSSSSASTTSTSSSSSSTTLSTSSSTTTQSTSSVAPTTASTSATTSSSSLLPLSYLATVGAVGLVVLGLLLRATRRRPSVIA